MAAVGQRDPTRVRQQAGEAGGLRHRRQQPIIRRRDQQCRDSAMRTENSLLLMLSPQGLAVIPARRVTEAMDGSSPSEGWMTDTKMHG